MLCQNCGKVQATRHYKSNINGAVQEAHLCADCARELGYEQTFEASFPHFGFGLGSLLSDLFPMPSAQLKPANACPLCGSTLADISGSGRLGCEECYDVFSDALDPYLKRMYGNAAHTGRVPKSAGSQIKARRELERLKNEMNTAVQAQEYEKAAKLRDEIKHLEGGGDQS